MKNKAYILVYREPYEGDTIYGVYSTEKKALKALKLEVEDCTVDNFLVLEVGVNQEPDWNSADVLANA